MYVTRPLSFYRGFPEAMHQPPKGPGSGYLVIQDEVGEARGFMKFLRSHKRPYLGHLPLPQDRRLTIEDMVLLLNTGFTDPHRIYLIPVINQPLSSNRYYPIIGRGSSRGFVSTCSTKGNRGKFLSIKYIKDEKPKPFDQRNVYQQLEIVPNKGISKGTFHAKSVAADGYPYEHFRDEPWGVYASKKHINPLSLVDGVDDALRSSMPSTNFSDASSSPHVVVGRWYCPYLFVREDGMDFDEQVEKSMFYKMTMEQFWEEIYGCRNYQGRGNVVSLRTSIEVRRVSLCVRGEELVEGEDVDGVIWFRPMTQLASGVGLDAVIVENMKWEEERGGWAEGMKKVERVEEFDGAFMAGWKKFRCFVLVERFALRRMDGSLILTYDFLHTDKIICKWE